MSRTSEMYTYRLNEFSFPADSDNALKLVFEYQTAQHHQQQRNQPAQHLHRNGTSSGQIKHVVTRQSVGGSNLPHLHLSLTLRGTNRNAHDHEEMIFYASTLELDELPLCIIEAPMEESFRRMLKGMRSSETTAHLSLRLLFPGKKSKRMDHWRLLPDHIEWIHSDTVFYDAIRSQLDRQHRQLVKELRATQCHNTTCALNRDHLGKCNTGTFFFFEDICLEPFDEIEYEVAKEWSCEGSVQMVMVTPSHGERNLCETPILSTGGWQTYQWQHSRLPHESRQHLRHYFSDRKHTKVTIGFYFLGGYGICNLRSVRLHKYDRNAIHNCLQSSQDHFSDVCVVCDS